jgi:hypothetical protein
MQKMTVHHWLAIRWRITKPWWQIKIACQLLVYQTGGHGFALYNKTQDEYWMPAFVKWLALNGFYKKISADIGR